MLTEAAGGDDLRLALGDPWAHPSIQWLTTALSELAQCRGVSQGLNDEPAQELSHRHVEFGRTNLEGPVHVGG